MSKKMYKSMQNSIKHWYNPLLLGMLLVFIGIYAFFVPMISFIVLAVLFSVSFLITGICEIVFSILNHNNLDNWVWILTMEIFTTLAGLLPLLLEVSMTIIPLYVGFLILFRSLATLGFAVNLKNYGILSWGYLMILGILGLLFSFFLLWSPEFTRRTMVILIGIAIIFGGAESIFLSIEIKRLKKQSLKLSEKHISKTNDLQNGNEMELHNQ